MVAINRPDEEPKDLGDMTEQEMIGNYEYFSQCAHMADSPHLPKASRSFAEALREIAAAYRNKTGRQIENDMEKDRTST